MKKTFNPDGKYCHNCMVASDLTNCSPKDCICDCHKKATPNPKQIKEKMTKNSQPDWETDLEKIMKVSLGSQFWGESEPEYVKREQMTLDLILFIRSLLSQEYERGAKMQAELDAKVIGGEKKC